MEKLAIILAFVSLPLGLFFSVANIKGSGLTQFVWRLWGIVDSVLSLVIIGKSLNLF